MWKRVFSTYFLLVFCATLEYVSSSATYFEKFHKSKRQLLTDICIIGCVNGMRVKLEELTPEFKFVIEQMQNDPFAVSNFNQSQVQSFCNNIYKPYAACEESCPRSKLMDTLRKAYEPVRFVCVDRYNDFQKSLPCLKRAEPETRSKCVDNVCKDFRDAPKRLIQAGTNPESSGDFSQFEPLLINNCKYLKCLINCETPIIVGRCGVDVSNLYQRFISISLNSIKETLKESGVNWKWPSECENVAN